MFRTRKPPMVVRAQAARFFRSRSCGPGAAHNRALDALAQAAKEWRGRKP